MNRPAAQSSRENRIASHDTSWSAPRIAGLAIDQISFLLEHDLYPVHTIVAGTVQADLMLMGDRYWESPDGTDSGFLEIGQDSICGGGRLRARLFTEEGMDAPWQWVHGMAPVLDGHESVIYINDGKPIPEGVDRLKVAVWWPEPNLSNGGENGADIKVRLDRTCGGGPVDARDVSFDPRKMIYLETGALSGSCYELVLHGISVPEGEWYPGVMARQGYYAYYYEDTARNDPDGPPPDVQ